MTTKSSIEYRYVCITTHQPDTKSNPNPNSNPNHNPTTKKLAIVSIQLKARFSLANMFVFTKLFSVCGPFNHKQPETEKTAPAWSKLSCFSNTNTFVVEHKQIMKIGLFDKHKHVC